MSSEFKNRLHSNNLKLQILIKLNLQLLLSKINNVNKIKLDRLNIKKKQILLFTKLLNHNKIKMSKIIYNKIK